MRDQLYSVNQILFLDDKQIILEHRHAEGPILDLGEGRTLTMDLLLEQDLTSTDYYLPGRWPT